jgi:hypothetical protein
VGVILSLIENKKGLCKNFKKTTCFFVSANKTTALRWQIWQAKQNKDLKFLGNFSVFSFSKKPTLIVLLQP